MLRIPNCSAVDHSVIQSLVKYCPKLAGLDISGCENITDEALRALGMLENINWLAISNTKVRILLCAHFVNFNNIKVSNIFDVRFFKYVYTYPFPMMYFRLPM